MLKVIKRIIKLIVFGVPQFTVMYQIMRDKQLKVGVPEATPLGFKFTGNAEIGMEQGTFEVLEVDVVKKCLSFADTFINIGANIGYYCCIALQQEKRTIAFEPIDSNLRYLYANIKANHWENEIEIFPLALGRKTDIAKIYGIGTGASLIKGWAGTSENDSRLIPVSTLDNVLADRLAGKKCFFLVDIEGVEKSMLQGASTHLSMEPKPIWMVEIAITEHQPEGTLINPDLMETFEIFWENGYEALTVSDEFRRINREDIEQVYESGKNTLLTYNFLFIDKNNVSMMFQDDSP